MTFYNKKEDDFEIANKGQELASKVTVSIERADPRLVFPDVVEREIDVIQNASLFPEFPKIAD